MGHFEGMEPGKLNYMVCYKCILVHQHSISIMYNVLDGNLHESFHVALLYQLMFFCSPGNICRQTTTKLMPLGSQQKGTDHQSEMKIIQKKRSVSGFSTSFSKSQTKKEVLQKER